MSATTATLDNTLAKIHSLPSLPLVATRLLEVIEDPDVHVKEIVNLVQADPALTAKVLKVVNSAFYGFQRKISTLTQAIPLIGFNALKQLCLGLSVLESMKSVNADGAGLDIDQFWEHCFACGCAARLLAPHCGLGEPEEGFVGGLIHDLGKLLQAQFAPAKFAEIIAAARRTGQPLHTVESRHLGSTHAMLGGALALHWKLPAQLVAAARFHHGGLPADNAEFDSVRPLVLTVTMANYYAKALNLGDSGCPGRSSRVAVCKRLGITSDKAQTQLAAHVRDAVSEVKQILRAS